MHLKSIDNATSLILSLVYNDKLEFIVDRVLKLEMLSQRLNSSSSVKISQFTYTLLLDLISRINFTSI